MKKNTDGWLKFGIVLVLVVLVSFYGVVFFRAFHLQVIEGKALEQRARLQHQRTVKIPSRRGRVFDRNLEELAVSIEVDSVYAQPNRIEDSSKVSSALAPLLAVDRRVLRRRLASSKKRHFIWLKRQVDLGSEQRELIRTLGGVDTVKESRRFYPHRSLAANLIGFTGIDSDGLEGVELYYDKYLRGSTMTVKAEKDATGKLLLFEDVEDGVRGMDVVLTIDRTIQYIAEKALRKAVAEHGAKGGTVVVMEPHTGEILAMANAPTYDPNDIRSFRPHQWRNRAVTDMFEPGSILKVFLLAAVLEEGILDPNDIFFCENGKYRVADAVFHDTKKFGWLSVNNIIKHSSNIGAVKIGERLGKRSFYRYLKAFGFGEKTGVDLPGESAGSLRHYTRWSDVALGTISFGQGISATSLQLVGAISAIANGGFLMKPRVVKYIRNSDGVVVEEFTPVILRRVLSEDTSREVARVLTSVTAPGGTGELASLDGGFKVAGKTGTAQKPDPERKGYAPGKYVSSFIGFVPAEEPRLSILVTLDEPQGSFAGGLVAAPVFKEIAKESLAYLGVFPEGSSPEGPPSGRVVEARLSNKASVRHGTAVDHPERIPDFRGKTIRSVLRIAGERSLDVDIRGSGRAVSQSPSPGGPIPEKGGVTVVFQ